MSWLEVLPRELFHLVLDYLTLVDIGIFDSAILNKSLRPLYICSLTGLEIFSECMVLLDWYLKRNIFIPSIIFYGLDDAANRYLSHFRPFIKSISLREMVNPRLELGHFASLTNFCVSGYHHLTDKDFEEILKLNPQLQEVSVSDTKLTPVSIAALAKYCPNLQSVDLSENVWVNDDSIDLLISSPERGGCQQLRFIDCVDTSITEVGVKKILSSFPHLNSIDYPIGTINFETAMKIVEQVTWPSLMSRDIRIVEHALINLINCLSKSLSSSFSAFLME
jgi:hypothetical protein